MSAAEPLPDDGSKVQGAASKGAFVDADIIRDDRPWTAAEDVLSGDLPVDDWCPDLPDVDSTHILTLAEHGVIGLPRRYLPHGCPKSLYWMFVSEEQARDEMFDGYGVQGTELKKKQIPSYTTFWRRWSQVWSKYLKMRKESQHSQCNLCFKLERDLHNGMLPGHQRLQAAEALRRHYHEMYLNRCIYWAMRCPTPVVHCEQTSHVIIACDRSCSVHVTSQRARLARVLGSGCVMSLPMSSEFSVLGSGLHDVGSVSFK